MTDLSLYLIRHASADERGPAYPDDSKRPLVRKGHQQAKTLARVMKTLDITLDRLFSSPYTRAAQSAEPLASVLKKGRYIQYLDTLASADYPQLLVDIAENMLGSDNTVALVGHEPYLGELASSLLSERGHVSIRFRKAAVLELTGTLRAGGMTLQQFLPAASYKQFRA